MSCWPKFIYITNTKLAAHAGFLSFQNGITQNTGKREHDEHVSQLAQGS